MNAVEVEEVPKVARVGWGILFAISTLLVLHGVFWVFSGPEVALESIAERTSLSMDEFQIGSPSAHDVIALTERNFAIMETALGMMALFMARSGFRSGSSLAWGASAILVAGLAAMALNFVAVGGLGGASLGFLGVAVLALLGWLMARGK